MTDSSRQGFTLIELSIVLVIIGLIIGGVLIGQEMIRASQLRSVIADVEAYKAAANMFQDKYGCIPGDCTNATTYWTAAANGDGDGQLEPAVTAGAVGENLGAWQQLALAGMIKGEYTGISGSTGTSDALIGTNVPPSRLTSGGYSWYYHGTVSSNVNLYDGSYGNIIYFGAKVSGNPTTGMIITPAEAYQIDIKTDDGKPGTGTVRTRIGTAAPNCGTTTNPSTSVYNITGYTGIACQLIFLSGF